MCAVSSLKISLFAIKGQLQLLKYLWFQAADLLTRSVELNWIQNQLFLCLLCHNLPPSTFSPKSCCCSFSVTLAHSEQILRFELLAIDLKACYWRMGGKEKYFEHYGLELDLIRCIEIRHVFLNHDHGSALNVVKFRCSHDYVWLFVTWLKNKTFIFRNNLLSSKINHDG